MPLKSVKDIDSQYALPFIQAPNGQVKTWETVLQKYPDYQIEVDDNGVPIKLSQNQYSDQSKSPSEIHHHNFQKSLQDPANAYDATMNLLNYQTQIAGGALLQTYGLPRTLTGLANVTGMAHGLSNIRENAANAKYFFNEGDYKHAFWNGLASLGNFAEIVIPTTIFQYNTLPYTNGVIEFGLRPTLQNIGRLSQGIDKYGVAKTVKATEPLFESRNLFGKEATLLDDIIFEGSKRNPKHTTYMLDPLMVSTKTYGQEKTLNNIDHILNGTQFADRSEISNAIINRTYRPLMTFGERRNYIQSTKDQLSEVLRRSEKLADQAADSRYPFGHASASSISPQLGKVYLQNAHDFKNGVARNYSGTFSNDDKNMIHLVTREHNNPILFPFENVKNVYAHEVGHFWQKTDPTLKNLAEIVTNSNGRRYYQVNRNNNKATDIFKPLLKYSEAEWEGSPHEVMSEIQYLSEKYNSDNLLMTHPEETLNYISNRFGITKEETAEMLQKMYYEGYYKKGGKIK